MMQVSCWSRITGRQRLLLYGSREPCPPEQQESFWRLLQRRATGEPLQYILGEWDFYGRAFKVGDGVLIPRGDTEALIEAVLKLPLPSRPLVADLCSGSRLYRHHLGAGAGRLPGLDGGEIAPGAGLFAG